MNDAEDRFVHSHPDYVAAQKRSLAWAERRHALPPGSTRARVTTANANWARAAEHRDRVEERLRREFQAAQAQAAQTNLSGADPPPTPRSPRKPSPRASSPPIDGQQIQIGRLLYRIEATGKETVPYVLHGPRGGRLEAIRNVKSGVLFLMQGARTLSGYATDTGGTFIYRA